jgi:hypothetical protein
MQQSADRLTTPGGMAHAAMQRQAVPPAVVQHPDKELN